MNSTDGMTEEHIAKIVRYHACAVCGWELKRSLENCKTVIVCGRFREHQGVGKPYESINYNIATRREYMTNEIGAEKTRALEKYAAVTGLTKQDASHIIDTIWPEARGASPAEVFKAISICVQYSLNPLLRHLYLIPFGAKYVTVLGIGANRLIASRKHSYSYIDDSPRLMSDEEQMKVFGEIDAKNLHAITVLKDMKTGATARGYGSWSKFKKDDKGNDIPNEPKGIDKGNSKANMAFIRSERQALDRLYPADMPQNVEVVDERYEVTVEPPTQPPPGDAPAKAVKESAAQPVPAATQVTAESSVTAQTEQAPPASKPEAETTEPGKLEGIDMDWLAESLIQLPHWKVGAWLREHYPKAEGQRVRDILKSMTVEQRKEFGREVQSRLEML